MDENQILCMNIILNYYFALPYMWIIFEGMMNGNPVDKR